MMSHLFEVFFSSSVFWPISFFVFSFSFCHPPPEASEPLPKPHSAVGPTSHGAPRYALFSRTWFEAHSRVRQSRSIEPGLVSTRRSSRPQSLSTRTSFTPRTWTGRWRFNLGVAHKKQVSCFCVALRTHLRRCSQDLNGIEFKRARPCSSFL